MGLATNIIVIILFLVLAFLISYYLIVLSIHDEVSSFKWKPRETITIADYINIIIGIFLLIIITGLFILLMLYINRGDIAVKLSKSSFVKNKIQEVLNSQGILIDVNEIKLDKEDIIYCAESIGPLDHTGTKCANRIRNNPKYEHLFSKYKNDMYREGDLQRDLQRDRVFSKL